MAASILTITGNSDLVYILPDKLQHVAIPGLAAGQLIFKERPEEAEQFLESEQGQEVGLLVIDALLPRSGRAAPDSSGTHARDFLTKLRRSGNRTPALVLTHQMTAPHELDLFCIPENRAIALPMARLDLPGTVKAFTGMLHEPPQMTWNTIEIWIRSHSAKCYLGTPNGKLIEWGETAFSQYELISSVATLFEGLQRAYDRWLPDLRHHGLTLFQGLVIGSLGSGLFAHIERAASGLTGLAFRFRTEDPHLYAAPFEAIGRASEKGAADSPFILLHAPVARRVAATTIRTMATTEQLPPHSTQLLFVRSQVAENPKGASDSDTAALHYFDQSTGAVRLQHYAFRSLENIDLELNGLRQLADTIGEKVLKVTLLDLSDDKNVSRGCEVLKEELQTGKYDIVHFAGHSLSLEPKSSGKTYLILPSAEVGEAVGMPMETFAEHAGKGGVRLVYLSSCQGSSAKSVVSLVQHGVSHVVGFRWDVEDDRAAGFAVAFYTSLFKDPRTVSGAFRAACSEAHEALQEESLSPIWASPILVAQTDDWAVRPFT